MKTGRPKTHKTEAARKAARLESYRRYNAKPERKAYQRHHWRTGEQVDRRRSHRLRTRFGITLSQYRVLHEKQRGLCAICRRPERTKYKRGDIVKAKPLSVDHCHRTGRVRGLLCFRCNVYLGFEELRQRKSTWVRAAARYLKKGAR